MLPLLPAKNYISALDSNVHSTSSVIGLGTTLPHEGMNESEPAFQPFSELVQPPRGVQAQLRSHQLTGVSFLHWLHRNAAAGILADEMGLGKTLQALALLELLHETEHQEARTHLIVCPLSVLETWTVEAAKFTPNLSVIRLHGPPAQRYRIKEAIRTAARSLLESIDIVVTSYETYDREYTWLNRFKWGWVILDEGHRIKNGDTQLSKRLLSISSENRLVLTGTPVHNNMFELWSLFRWLYPDVFADKSSDAFRESFILGRDTKVDSATIDASRRFLEIIMLRRTKADVDLNLPPLREIVLRVPLTPTQRDVYKSVIRHEADLTQPLKSYTRLLNLLLELRQVSIHPDLLSWATPEHDVSASDMLEASGKFIVLRKLLLELILEQQKKVIIFSCFTKALDCVDRLLSDTFDEDPNVESLRIDGGTGRALRNLNIRLFQDQKSRYRIMLVSVRSGGTGLTLTAAEAVIFLDEDFNPQVTLQAQARAHRIGQDKAVTVYKLYSHGTVEEQMLARIAKKLALSARMMDDFENCNLAVETDGEKGETSKVLGTTLSTAQLVKILASSQEIVQKPTFSLPEMLAWTFTDIQTHCSVDLTHDSTTADDDDPTTSNSNATTAFAGPSTTNSYLFEGISHPPARRPPTPPPAPLDRAARRPGKSTTVLIAGHPVSKSSLACRPHEAVPTLAGIDPSLRSRPRAPRPTFTHEAHCCLCRTRGAPLGPCADCPHSMHAACASAHPSATAPGTGARLRCPAHACAVCGARMADAGGLLYRCVRCVRAFCEEHLDWARAALEPGFVNGKWEGMGYSERREVFWVECGLCAGRWREEVEGGGGGGGAAVRREWV